MNPFDLWTELVRRNRLLALAGLGMFALAPVLVILMAVDGTQILGINRWIKPLKFSISIGIFLWTMGWLLHHLAAQDDRVRFISYGLVITMVAEIVPITGQAARGRLSHFNNATPFDSAVFSFMGVMILINTLLVLYALVLFFRSPAQLPPAYLWGIRFGMLIFILAGVEGGLMAAWLRHSVGVPDGGAGLPLVNWSTQGGDLRVAHFIGLHALQALPLAGFLLERFASMRAIHRVRWMTAFALIYAAVTTALFIQALQGRPLLAMN